MTSNLEGPIVGYIAEQNAAGVKPNVDQIAQALGAQLDEVGRAIRPLIDSGELLAARFLPGDDGYWASGLSLTD